VLSSGLEKIARDIFSRLYFSVLTATLIKHEESNGHEVSFLPIRPGFLSTNINSEPKEC
jgi:hypothetical protein